MGPFFFKLFSFNLKGKKKQRPSINWFNFLNATGKVGQTNARAPNTMQVLSCGWTVRKFLHHQLLPSEGVHQQDTRVKSTEAGTQIKDTNISCASPSILTTVPSICPNGSRLKNLHHWHKKKIKTFPTSQEIYLRQGKQDEEFKLLTSFI